MVQEPAGDDTESVARTSFEATESDLVGAYRLHFLNSIKRKRAWTRLLLAALVCAALSAAIFGPDLGVALAALLGAAEWFAFLGAMLLTNLLVLPRRVRRIFAQQKSLRGETRVEWSDESIAFFSSRGHSRFQWTDFTRLVDGRETILLMQSDALFNFIPKRALSADQAASIASRAAVGAASS